MAWEAQYKSGKGKPFTILGTTITECPVSLILDESISLVHLFTRSRLMHETFGASPYGGDLNKWPAREVDAFVILEEERKKVENLRVISDR